jgi:drug/metabolite transporter (DMT)-like permease
LGFALLLALLWGLQWPLMKVALNELGPWTFRGLSLSLGALVLMAIAALGKQPLRLPRRDIGPLLLVAIFATTGWQLMSAYGVSLMPPGRAVILGFTMPLWVVVLSGFLLKERPTTAQALGLLLGLTGMGILMGPEARKLGTAPLGPSMMLVAAACWATGVVLVKFFSWSIPTITLASWQLLLGSLPILGCSFIFESVVQDVINASAAALAATAFAIFIANSVCIYAWFRFIQLFSPQVAAISILLVPVVGVLASALIVGNQIEARDLVALALVVASLGLVTLKGVATPT